MQSVSHLDTHNLHFKQKREKLTPSSNSHSSCSLTFLETNEKYLCNLSLMTTKVQSHYLLLLNCLLFYGLTEGMTHCYRNSCAHPQPALTPPAQDLLSYYLYCKETNLELEDTTHGSSSGLATYTISGPTEQIPETLFASFSPHVKYR